LNIPTRDEIRAAYRQGEEAIIQLFERLIHELQAQQDRLNKNSKNSSKPPSSDAFKKHHTKSTRKTGSKKSGGQKGHKGHTLEPSENPDHTEVHKVGQCAVCGVTLEDTEVVGYQKRQVFDIPPIQLEVTEHQAEIKICSCCGTANTASFPPDVTASVQYGSRVKALAVYLNNYQFVPLERISEFFEDVVGHRPSEAIALQANITCAESVKPANEAIKEQLINADVVNFDETGLQVENKLNWLHVACTPDLTYYNVHQKRGREAMDTIGILPEFGGRAVHDHWSPYFGYDDLKHSLCNSHHLRDLLFVYEQYGQEWAEKMSRCLIDIKEEVDLVREYSEAERDVRMMKVKQKVSGTFRTAEGMDVFCAIRGCISTARKNECRVLDAIHDAFRGFPFIPSVGSIGLAQG
jgi:transposase